MRFKSGLLLGAAAGYVLGTKAGRKRYEQIKRLAGKLRRHPAVEQLVDQATALTDLGRSAAADGVDKGAEALRKMGDRTNGAG